MKGQQQPQKKIDYQLHKAQQLEILNQTLDLMKNNIYGQSQVDIVLYALSEGMSKEDAVDYSLDLIDIMNSKNLERLEQKRAEQRAKAEQQPTVETEVVSQVQEENLSEV